MPGRATFFDACLANTFPRAARATGQDLPEESLPCNDPHLVSHKAARNNADFPCRSIRRKEATRVPCNWSPRRPRVDQCALEWKQCPVSVARVLRWFAAGWFSRPRYPHQLRRAAQRRNSAEMPRRAAHLPNCLVRLVRMTIGESELAGVTSITRTV